MPTHTEILDTQTMAALGFNFQGGLNPLAGAPPFTRRLDVSQPGKYSFKIVYPNVDDVVFTVEIGDWD